jgi:hypothetical protein
MRKRDETSGRGEMGPPIEMVRGIGGVRGVKKETRWEANEKQRGVETGSEGGQGVRAVLTLILTKTASCEGRKRSEGREGGQAYYAVFIASTVIYQRLSFAYQGS